MSDAPIAVVVFDLDGVFRQWNDDQLDEVEQSFGLPPRTILDVAFSTDLGPLAVTGRLTFPEWMTEVRQRVTARYGDDAHGAIDEWEANVGRVDTDMIAMLRQVRARTPAAMLSNGTTRLRRDLHVLDLLDEFDHIFNTAELGIAKPDPDVFRLVCTSLGVTPEQTLFIDDLAENVHGASEAGLHTHQHLDQAGTTAFLQSHGILP